MRRPSALTIVLGVLCVGLLGVATNIATGALPEFVQEHAWIAWLLVAIALLAMAAIELRRDAGSNDRSAGGKAARATLLERCERYWIKGLLDRSLYREARIELGFDIAIDPSLHPWDMVAAPTQGEPQPVPAATPMRAVFDDLGGAMLILGDPGAGKTTMLLELLRDLLADARQDPEAPIPVVVNLSSWAVRRRPLAVWLAQEIAERYQIAQRHPGAWIQQEQLLPLLDGLDEVAEEHREACVAAINEFHRQYTVRLVVCSRTADYERMRVQLRLYGTVTILPLTRVQIDDFLHRAGSTLDGLRSALAGDPHLWDTIESPLMLSVAALAYADAGTGIDTSATSTDPNERLWSTYVRAMLSRRRDARHPPAQTMRSLILIARKLRTDNLSFFSFDLLSDDWLPPRRSYPPIFWTVRVAGGGVAFSVVLGFLGVNFFGWPGLVWAAANAVLIIVVLVAISMEGGGILKSISDMARESQKQRRVQRSFFGSLHSLGEAVDYVFRESWDLFVFAVPLAAVVGLVFGLSTGVWIGVAAGVGQAVSLFVFFVIAKSVAVLAGELSSNERRRNGREVPSPGLLVLIRLGIVGSLVAGGLAGVLAGLIVAWPGAAEYGRSFGIITGVTVTLSIALPYVGIPLVEQLLVRSLIARSEILPWPGRPLLDHASRLLLLRKVGQDYIFVHRELLDFFAGLSPERLPSLLPEPSDRNVQAAASKPVVSPSE